MHNAINNTMDLGVFVFIHSVGLPIASAIVAGYFVYLTVRFILAGVVSCVNTMSAMIGSLDRRIDTMNNNLQKIDIKICHSLGLEPDYERIARADREDQRKD